MRHKESLSLTEWYLNNVENQVQEAIYSRFSHFLMDETQDTSVYQFELIEKVIDNRKIIFQKFGDPYQALYNLYNNEENAWIPMDEDTLQISKSNRFGETIANVLRTTCVEEYGQLQGNKILYHFRHIY